MATISVAPEEAGGGSGVDATARASAAAAQATANAAIPKNDAITGATKTKITYDSLGRVTGGADATTADVPDSTDKRYVTDAMLAGLTPPDVRTISGTTDTLVLADAFQTVKASDASPTTVTVPPHSDVAFNAKDAVSLFAGGAGTLVISPGAGVTLKSAGVTVATLAIPAGQGATVIQTSTQDTWDIVAVPTPTAEPYTPAAGTPTVTLNCAGKDEHFVNCHADGGAITFAIVGATNNQVFFVRLKQGAVAATVTAWFAGLTWRNTTGGAAPALPAAGKVGYYCFLRTGTDTYDGLLISVES